MLMRYKVTVAVLVDVPTGAFHDEIVKLIQDCTFIHSSEPQIKLSYKQSEITADYEGPGPVDRRVSDQEFDGEDRRDEMKPTIIVTCPYDADQFYWMSVEWYSESQRGTPKAEQLFSIATDAIDRACDVTEAIANLEEAGFQVIRPDGRS